MVSQAIVKYMGSLKILNYAKKQSKFTWKGRKNISMYFLLCVLTEYRRLELLAHRVTLHLVSIILKGRLQNCEMRLLASSCLSVLLSIRMEQLGSHRTDFHEIWYLSRSIFEKSVEKIFH